MQLSYSSKPVPFHEILVFYGYNRSFIKSARNCKSGFPSILVVTIALLTLFVSELTPRSYRELQPISPKNTVSVVATPTIFMILLTWTFVLASL
jgi:hypothetical protein